MKKCPKCGKEYDDNFKFCQKDGTQLIESQRKKKCSGCGTENDGDATYCCNCGKKLGNGIFQCTSCHFKYSSPVKFCKKCGGKVVENGTVEKKKKVIKHIVNAKDMVFISGGSLWLGDDSQKDNPKHNVTLNSFYISKYQVTQELWNKVMSYDHSEHIGMRRPVDNVSWYDAVVFCNALSKTEGLTPCYKIDKKRKDSCNLSPNDNLKWTVECNFMANGYRLPTESEWEYAARGGQESRGYDKYAGSDNSDEVAWFYGSGVTHNVGEKKCNELGLYDMSGNVHEWCWDWWGIKGFYRVRRGGSYLDGDWVCPIYDRGFSAPEERDHTIGFRLVRSFI